MINDEIGSLFEGDPSAPKPMSLRQGVVESWDPDTGENSIQIAGGTLVNIPALTGESMALAAGDVVALLTTGDSWLVIGKVTTPGDPGTVPTWAGDITALAPLTELAAVTEGTTISGATLATTETPSGRRIVISQDDNRINFYSGQTGEVVPAALNTDGADLHLIGPIFDDILNDTGQVFLQAKRVGGTPYASVSMDAKAGLAEMKATEAEAFDSNTVFIVGTDAAADYGGQPGVYLKASTGAVRIGDGTDYITIIGQAVTDADLSSPTNTFPANPQPVFVSTATNLAVASPALTNTFAAGATVLGTTFVAPPSGSVYITVGGRIENSTALNTTYLSCEVRTGATVGSGTVVLAAEAGARAVAAGTAAAARTGGSRRFPLTGLTPSSTYNVRTMHAGQAATGGANLFNRELLIEPVL